MAFVEAILLCSGTLTALTFCLILIEFIEELIAAVFDWHEILECIHLVLAEAYTFSIHS